MAALALKKQRQMDLCEFEVILVFQASSKTARAVSRNKTRQTNKQKSPVICSCVYVITVGRNMDENVFLGNMKPGLLDLSQIGRMGRSSG